MAERKRKTATSGSDAPAESGCQEKSDTPAKRERKGKPTAADLALVRARVDAIFSEAKTFTDAADGVALEGLKVIAEALSSSDDKMRFQAARDLAYIRSRIPEKKAPDAPAVLTPEERESRLAAALETKEAREWLGRRGWEQRTQ